MINKTAIEYRHLVYTVRITDDFGGADPLGTARRAQRPRFSKRVTVVGSDHDRRPCGLGGDDVAIDSVRYGH